MMENKRQRKGIREKALSNEHPFPVHPALYAPTLELTRMCLFLPPLISNLERDRLKDTQIKQCSHTVTCDK